MITTDGGDQIEKKKRQKMEIGENYISNRQAQTENCSFAYAEPQTGQQD